MQDTERALRLEIIQTCLDMDRRGQRVGVGGALLGLVLSEGGGSAQRNGGERQTELAHGPIP